MMNENIKRAANITVKLMSIVDFDTAIGLAVIDTGVPEEDIRKHFEVG